MHQETQAQDSTRDPFQVGGDSGELDSLVENAELRNGRGLADVVMFRAIRRPVPLQAPDRPSKLTTAVRTRRVERDVDAPISRNTVGKKFDLPMIASNPLRSALALAGGSGVKTPRRNRSLARAF